MQIRFDKFHPDAVLATGHDAGHEPELSVDDIQGHILPGFGTSHQLLIGLKTDPSSTDQRRKVWLSQMAGQVSSLRQVNQIREVRRAVSRAQGKRPDIPDVMLGIALGHSILSSLGLSTPTTLDPLFKLGMRQSVNLLQDPIDASGNPIGWKLGSESENTPDVLLIIGSDAVDRIDEIESNLPTLLEESGFLGVYTDRGRGLFDSQEHFGFRDDISQPAVRGRLSPRADHVLARRYLAPEDPRHEAYARPGQPLIWPGQFVFGYPTQVEGQPEVPGPIALPPAAWMANGSYLVFRRLRQDVAKFRRFSAKWASTISQQSGELMTQDRLEGLMVGRWKDGTPLMQSPGGPESAIARDPQRVNFFSYKTSEPDAVVREDGIQRTVPGTPADLLGTRCPHFAHVRKVNNRGATDLGELSRFLILRRGIPYGADFVGPDDDSADRGLLFFAYMRSIRDQFLVLSQTWMNSATAPEENGHDLLVGQNRNGRVATLKLPGSVLQITADSGEQWVLPTGGAYLFVPSISVLKWLSSQPVEEHQL